MALTASENEAAYRSLESAENSPIKEPCIEARLVMATHLLAAALFAVADGNATQNERRKNERRKIVRLTKHEGGTCYVDPGNVSGVDEALGTVRLQTRDGVNYGAIKGTADEVVQALGMVYEDGTTSKGAPDGEPPPRTFDMHHGEVASRTDADGFYELRSERVYTNGQQQVLSFWPISVLSTIGGSPYVIGYGDRPTTIRICALGEELAHDERGPLGTCIGTVGTAGDAATCIIYRDASIVQEVSNGV